jgi:hypothetical protein
MPVPKNFSYGALAPYLPPLPAEKRQQTET